MSTSSRRFDADPVDMAATWFSNIRADPSSFLCATALSVAVVLAALVCLGFIAFAETLVDRASSEAQVVVFLNTQATTDDTLEIRTKLEAVPGVRSVRAMPRAEGARIANVSADDARLLPDVLVAAHRALADESRLITWAARVRAVAQGKGVERAVSDDTWLRTIDGWQALRSTLGTQLRIGVAATLLLIVWLGWDLRARTQPVGVSAKVSASVGAVGTILLLVLATGASALAVAIARQVAAWEPLEATIHASFLRDNAWILTLIVLTATIGGSLTGRRRS